MQRFKFLCLTVLLGLFTTLTGFAQVEPDSLGHYADPKQGAEANPTNNPDYSLMQGATSRRMPQGRHGAPIAQATSYGLPDHVNNGATKYFRSPVANQSGNSCGITSRHSHMMAYELNAYRDKDGSLAENMLPAHFAFVPAYREDPNKENYAKYVGVPDGATFGGTNVSTIYGGPYSESSNNYGRMQGYENWHKAMFNRITDNPNFPKGAMTEEGALAWKRWLYNHNGDESFHAGGVIGIGLASSGLAYTTIGSTTANDNAGVTGMYYLTHWGTGVDHAMAVVGYDDRIEFDLDGNGTYGETSNSLSQNETGAWIVANSWGSSWCNNGFLYVPYALGSPTSVETSSSSGKYKAGDDNGWTGEIYKIRKDYTPIRTLKAAVAYSKRSEIQICVGISTNLNATAPEKTLVLANHDYHGDYDSDGTDAEVPMLGQWSDGKLHTEAMEFGYDLTDFTDEFGRHVPLKYFLIINTKSGASGTGQIEYASIMDYELNANGIETPFASKNVSITNNGGTTTISTIVYGEEVCGPDNLTLTGTTLSWDAPQGSSYTPSGYYVYKDGERIASTTSRTYDIGSATGVFHVTASIYENNGAISESPASNKVVTGLSSSSFITYIGEPITSTSALTSGSYVVLKCYGRNKYVYDNGSGNAYALTTEAPEILDPDDYKYVFKVGTSGSYYTLQSLNGYLPLGNTIDPRASVQALIVGQASGSSNLFYFTNSSYQNSYWINGGESNLVVYSSLDNNSKFYIYPVHVSIPSTNTLNVSIANPGTVYAGAPVQLSLEGAADIASASWTVAGTAYTGVSPVVTFSSTGSKSVSCTATDSKGNSQTVNTTITVSAAPTATASFTLSSASTTGSDRISFISQNTLPGCTYSWSMPDAEETTATTRNASASYLSSGQKTVTLTVTDPNSNVYTHSETFMVNASVPKSRYTISPAIVVKNNTVTLTDNTLYSPSSWSWRFDSDNNQITCTTQNGIITPTKAGVYKLTFGTSNELGSDFVEQERALIVCNSASYQGLTFAGGNQNVTASLSSALTTAWTIDYWFNPSSLGSTTQGITGSKNSNSFTITSAASGVATLSVGSSSVSTDEAFYIANEWHHYAITFSSGTVKFYRDGSEVSSKSVSTTNFSNYFQNLQLGGSSAPMSGSIDEFRVWNTTLSQENIRSYCVAPISASTSGLKLYWQMNQSSGNVTDATSNGVTGTRNNFNNDGDAWSDSEGVFALDFSSATTPSISATQLSHVYDNVYSVSDEQDGGADRSSLGNAFDGNTSTYYQSQWEAYSSLSEISYPHSFILRRGALHEVSALSIYSNTKPTNTVNAATSASSGRAKYVTIEESDDALNWNYVDKNVRLYDLATNNVNLPWPITKEYVRFTFSEPIINDGSYVALLINEMNFYGTANEPTKTEVPLTYVACSDESTYSGDVHRASEALDGDASTFWHSSWYGTAVTYPHTITIQNTSLSDINMLYFYQQHSYSGNQNGSYRAGVVNVETSSNNSSWTTAFEGLRIPYGNTGYVKLPEAINARYIRLTFTRNQTSVGNGTYLAMNEIKAYGVEESVIVTWNVEDENGVVKYSVRKVYPGGSTISDYPDELKAWEEKYVQYPTLTPFTATNTTKTVTCTYNTPFTVSNEDVVNYYYLRFLRAASRENTNCMNMYLSGSDLTDGALQMLRNDSQPANSSETYKLQWAFYGNPFDGFTIKNRVTAGSMYHNNALSVGGIPVMSESNSTVWTVLLGKYISDGSDTYKTDKIRAAMADGTMCIMNSNYYWANHGYGDLLKFSYNTQADWLTQIIPTFVESVNTSNTVTWNLLDADGNLRYTVDKVYAGGTTISTYPEELAAWEDKYVQLEALTSFTPTTDVVKDVHTTYTMPFQVSNTSTAYYYNLGFLYYTSWYYDNANCLTDLLSSTTNGDNAMTMSTSNDGSQAADQWAFYGNPFDGFTIKNRGTAKMLYHNNALSNGGIPVLSESNETVWNILPSTYDGTGKSNAQEFQATYSTAITISSGTFFMMNYNGDHVLKFYTNAQADKFAGIEVTLAVTEDLMSTVTWNVVDGSNNVLYTVDKVYPGGTTVSSYPEELTAFENRFVSYPALTAFTPTENMTKNVTYSWTGPFSISTTGDEHYYQLRLRNVRYLSSETNSDGVQKLEASATTDPSYCWAFYGNPFTGFVIRNAGQSDKALYAGNGTNTNGTSWPTLSDVNATNWIVTSCNDRAGYTNPFSINPSGADGCYWNDNGYTLSGSQVYGLRYYTAHGNTGAGSCVEAIAVTPAFPPCTVTWNVLDEDDNVVYTVDKEYEYGSTVSAYPSEMTAYEDYFVSYPSLTAFTVTSDQTKEVTYEWTGPFQFSTDSEKHLYYISNAYNGYLSARINGETVGAEIVTSSTKLANAHSVWLIKGNPFDGIQIRSLYDENTGISTNWSWYCRRTSTPTTFMATSTTYGSSYFKLRHSMETVRYITSNWTYDSNQVLYNWAGEGNTAVFAFSVEEADPSEIVMSGYYTVSSNKVSDNYLIPNPWNNTAWKYYNASTMATYASINDVAVGPYMLFEEQEDGTYHISKNGKYIAESTSGNLVATTDPSAAYACKISPSGDGFTIEVGTNSYVATYGAYTNWDAKVESDNTSENAVWLIEPVEVAARSVDDVNYYTTAYMPFNYTLPDGVHAYTITADGTTAKAHELTGGVPAGTGVLLVGEGISSVKFAYNGYSLTEDDEDYIAGNKLTGTYVNLASGDANYPTGSFYVFSGKNNVPGFYRYTGTLNAYKAFLLLDDGSSSIRAFTIVFGDEGTVTDIELLKDEENGFSLNDVSTWGNAEVYDLQGRRVLQPRKGGLYIVNGKKIYLK